MTDESGIKVPVTSSEPAFDQLALALVQLGENQRLRMRMGEAGRRRVHQLYSWGRKGELLRDLYLQVVKEARPK